MNLSAKEIALATNGEWLNIHEHQNTVFNKITTDSRYDCTASLFVALCGKKFDAHDFIATSIKQNAAAICINRNKFIELTIPETIPVLLVDDTTKAYQAIAAYHRRTLKNTVFIGLTGSNGKTSTKDILKSILSQEFGEDQIYATKANTNNHIGVPLNLLSVTPQHKYAIIELGTNHPGEISTLIGILNPEIALLTSVGPSHLEFFKTLKGVAIEKASIFKNFNKNKTNYAIIPYECPEASTIKESIEKDVNTITFGLNEKSDISINNCSSSVNSGRFEIKWKSSFETYKAKVNLPGKHQMLNCASAAALAGILGISHSKIIEYLKLAQITGKRMQVSEINGITCINDAYNANPASMKAGINYISDISSAEQYKFKNTYVVLGDMLELGNNSFNEHLSILKYAVKTCDNAVIYAVGNQMYAAGKKISDKKLIKCRNKSEAGQKLIEHIQSGDIVYLKSSNSTGIAGFESLIKEHTGK